MIPRYQWLRQSCNLALHPQDILRKWRLLRYFLVNVSWVLSVYPEILIVWSLRMTLSSLEYPFILFSQQEMRWARKSKFAWQLCMLCVLWSQPFQVRGQVFWDDWKVFLLESWSCPLSCNQLLYTVYWVYSSCDKLYQTQLASLPKMWIPSFQSSFRRRLEGWQAVRGLLQSVALEDTEDVFPSTIFDLDYFNMCSTIEKEELRLAAIQALKEATDLKFCEHCLLLNHSDPFEMRSAMMPAFAGCPRRSADEMPGMKLCLCLRELHVQFLPASKGHSTLSFPVSL